MFLLSLSSVRMRGYCINCKEYRSDDGGDAWGIVWIDGTAFCERCGHVLDLFEGDDNG